MPPPFDLPFRTVLCFSSSRLLSGDLGVAETRQYRPYGKKSKIKKEPNIQMHDGRAWGGG